MSVGVDVDDRGGISPIDVSLSVSTSMIVVAFHVNILKLYEMPTDLRPSMSTSVIVALYKKGCKQ
jgi:hypothetical protein